MVVLGLALRYTMRYVSWNGNSEAGKPHLEESMVAHVGNVHYMATPVGTILELTYEKLVPANPRAEEPSYSEPGFELESGLGASCPGELGPKDCDFRKLSLRKQSLENPGLETPHDGCAVPKYFTVLDSGDQDRISGSWIAEQVKNFKDCDTYQQAFLHGIVLMTSVASTVRIGEQAKDFLRTAGVKWIAWLAASEDQQFPLHPGPHYILENLLYGLHRLHDDTHDCFVTSIIQKSPEQPFESIIYHSFTRPSNLAVPVPSRLKRYGGNLLGLSGMRIAVKDNFDIEGIKTSLCNSAYSSFYPPAQSTATCIQKLLDKGAVVVGKTRLASFAATEEPIECIDWSAPWNPRADGHQSPAGSSSGSAAAIAAYEGLDIAIGTDTSGSGRRPAHWNGVVGMRPTHGVLASDGLVPSFEMFDVPAFFGRDLGLCRRFAEAWYGEKLPSATSELPVKIILPVDYFKTIGNPDQLRLINQFVSDMEKFFGVEAERVELESLWAGDPPTEAEGHGLSEYMEAACRNSFWHDDFHHRDAFRSGYEKRFGKKAYVSPPVRCQWNIAARITQAERNDAVNKLGVYQKWFMKNVMRPTERNTIVVLPIEEISPRYRDMPSSRDFYPRGVESLFLSPIVGCPELTIPIGVVPYDSIVTDNREHLPVEISLMASPGYDLILMDLTLECLRHSSRPISVQAGKHVFFKC